MGAKSIQIANHLKPIKNTNDPSVTLTRFHIYTLTASFQIRSTMLHPCSNLLAIDAWHYFAMRLLAIHSLSIVSRWHSFAYRWVSTCLGHVWPPPRMGTYWTNKPLTKYTWTLGPDGTVIEYIFEQPSSAPATDPDACATHWKPANQRLVPTTSSHLAGHWTIGPDGTVIEYMLEQPPNDQDACASHQKPANKTLVPTTSSHQTWTLGPDGTWWPIDEKTSRWNMIQHIQTHEDQNLGYGILDLGPLTTAELAEMCADRGINTNLCHELVFHRLQSYFRHGC